MNFYIYKLYYNEEPKTIYIGKTSNLTDRLTSHLNLGRLKDNTPKNTWIKSKNNKGWKLQLEVIETIESEDLAYSREIFWIDFYKCDKSFNVKNSRNGGIGGMLGLKHSEETKKKISVAGKGRVVTEETKQRMSKPKSESHKRNISLSKMGNKHCLGIKHTEESRKKMSDAQRGLKKSQSTIDKLSKYHRFIDPEGATIEVFNLSKFCRENNLTQSAMSQLSLGKRNFHKGYRKVD